MARAAIILQARLGSSRLPGKVLARVGSRTILEHCLLRLSVSGLPIIVATTDRAPDDLVEREARSFGAEVFRGAEHNVLSRFIAAARAFGVSDVIRATADNPLVDPRSPRRVLEFLRHMQADHVVEIGVPVGTAVEAVTLSALERAEAWISEPYDREHVTSFIRRDPRFLACCVVAPSETRRSTLRLTVDTPEDLEFVRNIFARLKTDDAVLPRLAAVIQAAEASLSDHMARERVTRGA